MRKYLFLIIFLLVCIAAKAQTPDTTVSRNIKNSPAQKNDTVVLKPFRAKSQVKKEKVYHPDSNHSVRGARIRSMILPGWGQIYNKHGLYWRLPLLYSGLGALIYNLISNGGDYNDFLKESEWRAHGRQGAEPLPVYNGTIITNISDQTIYDFKDQLRRNRDLTIFGLVAVWGINVIDAYVEAKFIHSYTMDQDLSFKVTPQLMAAPQQPVYASNLNTTFTPGLKITFLFK
ncbi:hypothetical protein KXQ82_04130 [Mucilaginibacter sp. HMF5004]|uniref:DUF5683 domain-containing protein n=1 Tax=Mucilaginibacter rivuli TaxID=2857527 RepID=UPI001C5CC399|nr:DUF5683 domain-containing protein [Mucilaginibacter rivuli]MBW4888884.1 hypothetical protein [Mucilaginibacter rivuli]